MDTKSLISAVSKENVGYHCYDDCTMGTHNDDVIEKLKYLSELEEKIRNGQLVENTNKSIQDFVSELKELAGSPDGWLPSTYISISDVDKLANKFLNKQSN